MKPYILKDHYPSGVLRSRSYYMGDQIHREDDPAIEWFNEDGTLRAREWRQYGLCHRKDGPAYESFYNDGSIPVSYTHLTLPTICSV